MSALLPPPKTFSVDISKIVLYLLNTKHPMKAARAKARFFISYGFDPADPIVLADALILHAQNSL